MIFQPSIYQQKIFDWVQRGDGHALVEAVAGSGKTTTAVKAMQLIPASKSIIFLAFNKSIAEELASKVPRHAAALTLNSLGHRSWLRLAGQVRVNADKTKDLINANLTMAEAIMYGMNIKKLVGLAKAHGLVPKDVPGAKGLIADEDDTWRDFIYNYDIDLFDERSNPAAFDPECEDAMDAQRYADETYVIGLARNILKLSCLERAEIDFDDQIYFPVIFGAMPRPYDWIFVDEAQDLSPVQHRLVRMACSRSGGRIMAIGDSKQSIYGFRGADSSSMQNFGDQLGAAKLELSICYRCPKLHIEQAQKIVPQIQPAPNAPNGEILYLGEKWRAQDFQNTDLIICRNSAPMVRAAYQILSQRIAVRILGRDIGAGLTSLIKKLKPKSRENLIERLTAWRQKEIAKLLKRDREANLDKVEDKFETIMTFIDMFPGKGPDGLRKEIEILFSDNTKGILTLSTIHKAKGLEADRVYILNRELLPSKAARLDWQKQQERNLEYIALTRARSTLGFINIKKREG